MKVENEFVEYCGHQDTMGTGMPSFDLWNMKVDWLGPGGRLLKGSTVATEALELNGVPIPKQQRRERINATR